MEIRIEKDEITPALNRLLKASNNLSPVFRDIANSMLDSTKQRFGKGVAPDGTKWAKNSAVTIKKKGSNRPLIDSKDLANTISIASNDKEAEIYSSKIYAGVQQFGAKKGQYTKPGKRTTPWGDIPARPFLGISTEDENKITTMLRIHLEDSL